MRISRCFQNFHKGKLKQEKTWRFVGSVEKLVMSKLSFSASTLVVQYSRSEILKPVVVEKRTSDEQEVHNSDKDPARDRSLLQLSSTSSINLSDLV